MSTWRRAAVRNRLSNRSMFFLFKCHVFWQYRAFGIAMMIGHVFDFVMRRRRGWAKQIMIVIFLRKPKEFFLEE
jgi:hypothetical protein